MASSQKRDDKGVSAGPVDTYAVGASADALAFAAGVGERSKKLKSLI